MKFWTVIGNGVFFGAVFYLPTQVGMKLVEIWGWIAYVAVAALGNWYAIDWIYPRRRIHHFFRRSEPVLSHRLRFARQMTLFALLLICVAVTLVELLGTSENGSTIPSDAATPLAGITTAFLASVGWLYTRFEQDKADRAKATQETFKRFYDENNMSQHKVIGDMIYAYRINYGHPNSMPLPIAIVSEPLEILENRKFNLKISSTLKEPLDRFFNLLNQIAFGVRQGELDYQTVEMILRPRYIHFNYLFFEYIKQETAAKPTRSGRSRAQNRTWEHMLWLTAKLPMLKSDGTDWEHIVMPPDHIIGYRPGERIPHPRDPDIALLPDLDLISDALLRIDNRHVRAPDEPQTPRR